MILTSKNIKSYLRKMWPILRSEDNLIWLRAEEYPVYDSLDELTIAVDNCIKPYKDDSPKYECEFNADRLMKDIWEYDYKFFGVAIGTLFRNRMGNHTLNIAMVKTDFYFIDSKDKAIWLGDRDGDEPYFIWR